MIRTLTVKELIEELNKIENQDSLVLADIYTTDDIVETLNDNYHSKQMVNYIIQNKGSEYLDKICNTVLKHLFQNYDSDYGITNEYINDCFMDSTQHLILDN